jgi:hypothetical protein
MYTNPNDEQDPGNLLDFAYFLIGLAFFVLLYLSISPMLPRSAP